MANKTEAQRLEEFSNEVDRLYVQVERLGYTQGLREANPAIFNENMKTREDAIVEDIRRAQAEIVRMFTDAARAATGGEHDAG